MRVDTEYVHKYIYLYIYHVSAVRRGRHELLFTMTRGVSTPPDRAAGHSPVEKKEKRNLSSSPNTREWRFVTSVSFRVARHGERNKSVPSGRPDDGSVGVRRSAREGKKSFLPLSLSLPADPS